MIITDNENISTDKDRSFHQMHIALLKMALTVLALAIIAGAVK